MSVREKVPIAVTPLMADVRAGAMNRVASAVGEGAMVYASRTNIWR